MIFVQPLRSGAVDVRVVSRLDEGGRADGRRRLSPTQLLFGRQAHQVEPGVYTDDGAFVMKFEDWIAHCARKAEIKE